jgi:hypothetical protein
VWQKRQGLPRALLPGCLLALAVIDLWLFGARYLATFLPDSLQMDKDLKTLLDSDPEPLRVATPGLALLNIGMLEGIESVGGYDAIVFKVDKSLRTRIPCALNISTSPLPPDVQSSVTCAPASRTTSPQALPDAWSRRIG